MLHNVRNHRNWEVAPAHHNWRKSTRSNENPVRPKERKRENGAELYQEAENTQRGLCVGCVSARVCAWNVFNFTPPCEEGFRGLRSTGEGIEALRGCFAQSHTARHNGGGINWLKNWKPHLRPSRYFPFLLHFWNTCADSKTVMF